jgi:putative ABC transport system substrate-binding protein
MKALDASDALTIERGMSAFASEPNGGVILLNSAVGSVNRELITVLAARLRLPVIYPYAFYVEIGGLVSYGIDNHDLWRKAASYVDRILKGAKPADLPVQEPTQFELTINLKAAKKLGLNVPPALLSRADKVIRTLRAYACYYNGIRTHRSLDKDAPAFRSVQRVGTITPYAILGGLHHHYVRI